jgi:hypothetical protein
MCITRRKHVVHNNPDQHLHKTYHLQPSLAHHPCNHHYKKTSPQSPLQEFDSHSIFTVVMGAKNIPIGLHYKDSEPLYQEIGERIKYHSDGCENARNIFDKETVSDKLSDQKFNLKERDKCLETCEKAKLITNPVKSKPNIVYGMITAKEVAKYRPCTQDIILRPGIQQ